MFIATPNSHSTSTRHYCHGANVRQGKIRGIFNELSPPRNYFLGVSLALARPTKSFSPFSIAILSILSSSIHPSRRDHPTDQSCLQSACIHLENFSRGYGTQPYGYLMFQKRLGDFNRF